MALCPGVWVTILVALLITQLTTHEPPNLSESVLPPARGREGYVWFKGSLLSSRETPLCKRNPVHDTIGLGFRVVVVDVKPRLLHGHRGCSLCTAFGLCLSVVAESYSLNPKPKELKIKDKTLKTIKRPLNLINPR